MMDKLKPKLFSQFLKTLFVISIFTACASGPIAAEKDFQAKLSAKEAIDGSLLWVQIQYHGKVVPKPDAKMIKVSFEGTEYATFETETGYESLIGVPFNTPPRESTVEIVITQTTGEEKISLPLKIKDGQYKIENLSVEGKYVEPPKKTMKRILREQKEVGAIYRVNTPKRYWKGSFKLPIESEITSPYGGKRYYNGQMRNFHAGTDLRAKVGTPIVAPEAGKVVMSQDLYFTGHTIILDHGYGMYTLYAHMSERKVKVGEEVKLGDLLGLSGATGRISGPHLHWGLIIHKNKFNPMDLTRAQK